MKKILKEKAEDFSIILTVGGKKYKKKGHTLVEAIEKLKPEKIAGKTIISVKYKGIVKEFPFYRTAFLKKIMINSLARKLFEKRCMYFFQ